MVPKFVPWREGEGDRSLAVLSAVPWVSQGMEPAAEEGTSIFPTVFPYRGCALPMEVKALSDPGRNSEGRGFRSKTNLRLAQGTPAVASPGWGVREATRNSKGRGRAGPGRPGLRQPATEKRARSGVWKLPLFWSISVVEGLGTERGWADVG